MGAATTIWNALKTVLPGLAESDASIESKIVDVVGTFADSEAIERQNTLDTINNALAMQKVTTMEYYRRKAVAFQSGDQLSYDPVNFGGYYPSVDTSKQIIKQAYITGGYPSYTLLVNKIGSDGHLTTLTDSELSSFKTYFDAFTPVGLILNIVSLPVAKITDPGLVIYVRSGSDAGSIASQINDAFLNGESVMRKNNLVTLTELVDTMQSIQGVEAVGLSNPVATEVDLSGVTRTIKPEAGVFHLTNGAFTFGTTITTDMIKVLQ